MKNRLFLLFTILSLYALQNVAEVNGNNNCNDSKFFNPITLKCANCDDKSRAPNARKSECVCANGYGILFSNTVNLQLEQCVQCSDYGLIATKDSEFCIQCSAERSNGSSFANCPVCGKNKIVVYDYNNDYTAALNKSSFAAIAPRRRCVSCPPGKVPDPEQTMCIYCSDSFCFCSTLNSNATYCDDVSSRSPEADTVTVAINNTRKQVIVDYLHKKTVMIATKCRNGIRDACQYLANLCVLSDFNRATIGSACYYFEQIKANSYGSQSIIPDLFYSNVEASTELYRENAIDGTFLFSNDSAANSNNYIRLVAAAYHTNGTFIELIIVDDESFNVCFKKRRENALKLGKVLTYICEITVGKALQWNDGTISRNFGVDPRNADDSTIFYELYLSYNNTDGQENLHQVLIINENARENFMRYVGRNIDHISSDALFVRRFFTVDRKRIKSDNHYEHLIRVPELISLSIQFQSLRDSRIYPPYLHIRYRTLIDNDGNSERLPFVSEFSVKYSMDNFRYEKFLEVIIRSLCSLSLLFGLVKAYSWARRAGRLLIDTATIVKFILYTCENIANVFFLVMTITAVWIVYTYKMQDDVILFPLNYEQEASFTTYIITAAVLNAIVLLHNYVALTLVETFFIDWERPRFAIEHCRDPISNTEFHTTTQMQMHRKNNPVVIWRTYLIANEWNELQSYRKSDLTVQLLFILFLLEFLHFGDWAMIQPGFERTGEDIGCPETRMSRFAIDASFYILIFVGQWLVQILVREKVVDPFRNFMDLCSIANISVLTMTHSLHGFYIHGRSVHGLADTDMLEMNMFLQREKDNLCGMRGLENGSELQTFRVNMPRIFRDRLNQLKEALNRSLNVNVRQRGADRTTIRIESIALAYNEFNQFLKNVIDHADPSCDYMITDGKFVEEIARIELSDTSKIGTFTRLAIELDHSETGYSAAFLYANEWTQVLFEMLLFCLVDMATHSRTFACIVVYSVSTVIRKVVELFFTNHLVKSSLVDNRFLI